MKKSPITIQTAKGKNGLWYWHARAKNGKIVADGSEGYNRRSGAKRGCKSFLSHILREDFSFED